MNNLENEKVISKLHNLKLENMDNINITFIYMDRFPFVSINVTF